MIGNRQTTYQPVREEPDDSQAVFAATEHWTGPIHWIHFRSKVPRPGAPTLIFVHGAGHNEQVWTIGPDNWVVHFTRLGYDVIIVSLRGHKPSKGLVAFQTLEGYRHDAYTPAQVLGLPDEQTVYIGHSMGGIVVQMLLAQRSHLAGVVAVDSIAPHRALGTYVPFLRHLWRHHPMTLLRTLVNPAAMFGSDELVRELLVGDETSADLVANLRRTLGGETSLAMLDVLWMKRQGCQRLPGHKLLFIGAEESAFFPPVECEASASEQGALYVRVPGKHNLMMTASAPLAAQAITDFLARLRNAGEEATSAPAAVPA